MKNIRKIKSIKWHRNGTSGDGFYVVTFSAKKGKGSDNMLATVFCERGCIAILDLDDLDLRWRAEDFEDEIRAAVDTIAGGF